MTAENTDVQTQLIVPQLKDNEQISYPALSLPSSSKSKAPLKSLSNPSQALAHLEKHQAKLASLPEDKRKEAEERERWAKAEERAKGGKVADQEGTLKKAVKRLEKKKSKSGKEWYVDFVSITSQSIFGSFYACRDMGFGSPTGLTENEKSRNRTRQQPKSETTTSHPEMKSVKTRKWASRRRTRSSRKRVDQGSKVGKRAERERTEGVVGVNLRLEKRRDARTLVQVFRGSWTGCRFERSMYVLFSGGVQKGSRPMLESQRLANADMDQ